MNAGIIDRHLPGILKDLEARGLTYGRLQDDILDHICCMVEEEMEAGRDFQSSYRDVMDRVGENTLSDIQHQTLLLLDKKFQKMKKFTYATGLTGSFLTIAGAIMKMLHLPGASIMMLVGFLLIAFCFLPLYFIFSYREQAEKPKLIFPVVGYVSLLFILTGAVFKIMHWPGANIFITISIFVILVVFLPLYIVQIFKRTSTKKINPAYIIMVLVGLSIVILLTRVNISKYAVDRYTEMSMENMESCRILKEATTRTLEMIPDSLQTDEISMITEYAAKLEAMADRMLEGMLEAVDQPGVVIENVDRRDFRNAGRDSFNDNGLAKEFKALARKYRTYLLEHVSDPVIADQVNIDLRFSSDDYIRGWTPEDHIYDPLVMNYSSISSFKRAVLNAEYLAIGGITGGHNLFR